MSPSPASTGRTYRHRAWLAALTLMAAVAAARADRPFIVVTSAAAEEDDDRVWSLATVADLRRGTRAFSLSAEYAFDPVRSIEFGLGHSRLREEGLRTTDVEVGYKHLFNHIARDGYGWGLAVGWRAQRSSDGGWRGGGWSLVLPLSWSIGDRDALLHLNAGLSREPAARREPLLAAGIESAVWRRVTLFAEAAREGGSKLLHAGARWWVKRERLAVDIGATQRREDGTTRGGLVIGLAWYDL